MMINWELMFSKIFGIVVRSFLPIYSQFLKDLFFSQPVPLHIPCFERFGFIPKFKKPYVVEFSGLRGVAGCLWSNVIKYYYMLIDFLPLLKVPRVSDSAAEYITLRIVLHSVCMGPFLSGLGSIGLGEGQSLR